MGPTGSVLMNFRKLFDVNISFLCFAGDNSQYPFTHAQFIKSSVGVFGTNPVCGYPSLHKCVTVSRQMVNFQLCISHVIILLWTILLVYDLRRFVAISPTKAQYSWKHDVWLTPIDWTGSTRNYPELVCVPNLVLIIFKRISMSFVVNESVTFTSNIISKNWRMNTCRHVIELSHFM